MSFPVKILHAPLPLLFSGPPCLWQTVAGVSPSLWSCFPVRWTACSLRPSSDWHDFSRRSQAESSDRPASSGSLPVEQLVGVGEAQSAYCPCVLNFQNGIKISFSNAWLYWFSFLSHFTFYSTCNK